MDPFWNSAGCIWYFTCEATVTYTPPQGESPLLLGVDPAVAVVLLALAMTLTSGLAAIVVESEIGPFLRTDWLRREVEVSYIVALNYLSKRACAKCGDRGFTG